MSDTLPTNEDTSRDVGLTVRATYTATGEEEAFALSTDGIHQKLTDMLEEWPQDMILNSVIVQSDRIDPVGVSDVLFSKEDTVPMEHSPGETVAVAPDVDAVAGDNSTGVTEPDSTVEDASGDDTDTDGVDRPHRTPSQVLEDNASLYREKNADYGNSWRLVGETVALWADELGVDSVDVSDPDNAAALGLYWERLIKLVRAFNLEFSDQTPHNEATTESHADASTYAAMQAALEESRDD